MADTTTTTKRGSLGATSMRYHELALQAWLYGRFFVREGYPVPVVFGTPMDAFSKFKDLWAASNNPFEYLYNIKDDDGTPLYEPHPSAPRYPLISVMRKGWKYRQGQNFSIHKWRRLNWPTVSDDVARGNLGTVTTSYMPMAWDYKYQIDYFSMRPDTQAFFIENMMRQFWRTGGSPQTWINVIYPGIGQHYIRMYMSDETLDWQTPDEPESDKIMEFRTTVNITVEGYSIDTNFQFEPAMWTLVIGDASASVDELTYVAPLDTENLKVGNANPSMLDRDNIPDDGVIDGTQEFYGTVATDIVSFGTGTPPTPDPTYAAPPAYSYGIESEEAFGTPTVVKT
jgi:hypothetical protein